ncbi:MAG: gamma-glutamylcyclotransferase [Proteobacteria bacterium]|nr:gamma-glutamylcyclotransferase [Pseudomonadota bacterium]
MAEHLFVYGSLRRGAAHPMHRILARHATPLGPAVWQGRLYRVGWYPGAVASDDARDSVRGELYRLRLPRQVLPPLDRFENCGPGFSAPTEFSRESHEVHRPDHGSLRAWIYVYRRPVTGLPRIAGGDFLAEN